MPPARIGTEVAGYRIEALVGRGGTSTVYRAESQRLGIPVALKILNPDVAEDEAFRERFVRESRLAAGINHPNIITIYDAGVWEDALYIAMRYVGGGDLKRIVREGALSPARTLSILAQVASALDAAHAAGLVHRDVKPANVMVDAGASAASPEIAYVTDFGLIKRAHSGGRATPTGEFVGTIDYVAPEQIEGKPVDERADVYSLGCVVYECLTGQPPFHRDADAAVLWAHIQEPPPAVTAVRADVPAAVDDVVARALAKDPDERYATCGELVGALRRELEPEATPRSTLTVPIRRSPAARARAGASRAKLAAAALAGLALGGAGAAVAGFLDGDGGDRAAVTVTQATTVRETVSGPEPPPRLLALIPEPFVDRCKSSRAPAPEFDESVLCRRPARGIDAVRYSHALSGPLLTDFFISRIVAAGVPRPAPGARIPAVGSCAGRAFPAVEEWEEAGLAGHEPIGRTFEGNSPGRVLCHESQGKARVEWITLVRGVYAHAYGSNFARVYEWWRTSAGPIR